MNKAIHAITLEEIERGLRTTARIIDRYGDTYWPIFERLEGERDQLQSRKQCLAAYLDEPETVPSSVPVRPINRSSSAETSS